MQSILIRNQYIGIITAVGDNAAKQLPETIEFCSVDYHHPPSLLCHPPTTHTDRHPHRHSPTHTPTHKHKHVANMHWYSFCICARSGTILQHALAGAYGSVLKVENLMCLVVVECWHRRQSQGGIAPTPSVAVACQNNMTI